MKSRDYAVRASVFATVLFLLAGAIWAAQERATENKEQRETENESGNNPPKAGEVKGRGTKDRIPRWTDSSTLGDSIMSQNGNNVSVGGSISATSLALPNTAGPSVGVISFGGVPTVHIFSGIGNPNLPSNMFVGLNAGNFTMTGINNTATGSQTLFSNTDGTDNTALGTHSLFANTSGNNNTAIGVIALMSNTTGSSNTAIGTEALDAVTGGNDNIAIGRGAGTTLRTGDNNVYIGSAVAPGPFLNESNTIRIGRSHTQTFIAGISGVATGGPGAAVLVDSNGQLGTASSSRRFKYDIDNMGAASSDILKLRPVTFRYKQAQDDGSHPLQYGLVAEEVAKVYPGLVQFDKAGDPQTVLYHVLPAMLLNELQKEHRQIQAQQKLIQSQQEQLKAQEERLRSLEAILYGKGN